MSCEPHGALLDMTKFSGMNPVVDPRPTYSCSVPTVIHLQMLLVHWEHVSDSDTFACWLPGGDQQEQCSQRRNCISGTSRKDRAGGLEGWSKQKCARLVYPQQASALEG